MAHRPVVRDQDTDRQKAHLGRWSLTYREDERRYCLWERQHARLTQFLAGSQGSLVVSSTWQASCSAYGTKKSLCILPDRAYWTSPPIPLWWRAPFLLSTTRVRLGGGLIRSALGHVRTIAHELLEHGTYASMNVEALSGSEFRSLFPECLRQRFDPCTQFFWGSTRKTEEKTVTLKGAQAK